MSETPAIQTKGLAKTYRTGFFLRPVVGLQPLDIEVRKGEIFGFIGPNGAGKTTTIKMLMGLQGPTQGEAFIFGKPIDDPESRAAVGFLPERPYFYEHLTANEILDFYGHLLRVPKEVRVARANSLIERVNLQRFANIPLRKYSKGMLQRVGLCQALMGDPQLLVLDEPMSGLDPVGRALVRDIILEERDTGRTVFFSSHILHDVEVLSDRVGIIIHGQAQGVGSIDELVGDRVRQADVTFSGDSPGDHEVIRTDADGTTIRVLESDCDGIVAEILKGGGSVRGVTPIRESLEDLLLSEMDRAAPAEAKKLGVLA